MTEVETSKGKAESMKLQEGQMVMMQDGPARVERVTECSATVRYVVGVERTFTPVGNDGQAVTIRTPGRTVTISPHSDVALVCETPVETRARMTKEQAPVAHCSPDVAAWLDPQGTLQKAGLMKASLPTPAGYSIIAERQAAPLRGSNDGMREMYQMDLLDNTRSSLFAQAKGRKAVAI